ncbi:hypothetical protein VDGD_21267 [Verticillium dahliae]|nr:hypothetical protein VDGD_21267 [Verticillium dahliae]
MVQLKTGSKPAQGASDGLRPELSAGVRGARAPG